MAGISAGTAYVDIVPRFEKFSEKVGETAKKLNVKAFAIAGAAATAVAIKAGASFVDWGGKVKLLTRELGISAKEASRLAFVGRQVGLDVSQLSVAFGKLSRLLATNDDIFGRLGITIRGTDGRLRSFSVILSDIANKFKSLPDGPEKTALALQLFGKQGKELIPLLNKGADGFAELAKQADKLGFTLGDKSIEAVSDYKKAQKDLSASLKGLELQLGQKTTPVVTFFTRRLVDLTSVIHKIPAPVIAVAVGATSAAGGIALFAEGLNNTIEVTQKIVGWLRRLRAAKVADAAANIAAAAATGVNAAAVTAEAAAATRAAAATAALTVALAAETAGQLGAAGATAVHDAALASLASTAGLARAALLAGGKLLGKAFLVVAAGAAIATVTIKHFDGGIKELVGKMEDGTASAKDMNAVFDSLSKFTGRRLEDALARSAVKLRDFTNSVEGLQFVSDATRKRMADLLFAASATKDLGDDTRNLAEAWRLAKADVDNGMAALKGVGDAAAGAATKVEQFAGMTGGAFKSWRDGAVTELTFVKASLGELSNKANLTASQILAEFERMLRAQKNYAANFAELVRRRLPEDFRQQLADMGVQGAGIVDALANANEATFRRIVRDWDASGQAAMGLVRQIAGLPPAIAAVPKDVTITFHANTRGLSPALRQLEQAGATVTVGGVREFQHGGVVRKRPGGELFRVGEGAFDEAVIPLTGAGLGVTVNVTVQGNVTSERRLVEVVREGVLEAKRRNVTAGLR